MSTLQVENLIGQTSGSNANKVIIPSGQTLDASGGTLVPYIGQILQVKHFISPTTSGEIVTTSNSAFLASGVLVDITPKDSSSLIIVRVDLQSKNSTGITSDGLVMRIQRDVSTRIGVGQNCDAFFHSSGTSNHNQHFQMSFSASETANNTTSRRYEVYFRSFGGNAAGINYDWGNQTMTVMEIAQ